MTSRILLTIVSVFVGDLWVGFGYGSLFSDRNRNRKDSVWIVCDMAERVICGDYDLKDCIENIICQIKIMI